MHDTRESLDEQKDSQEEEFELEGMLASEPVRREFYYCNKMCNGHVTGKSPACCEDETPEE